VTINYS